MKTLKIKSGEIDNISNTLTNNLWGYDFQRIILKNGNMIDLPINCTIQPILREFDEAGTLVNFEDLKSVEFISGIEAEISQPEEIAEADKEDKIENLITYYENRLNECVENRKQLLESNVSKEVKDRLHGNWNVRINEVSGILLVLRYGIA